MVEEMTPNSFVVLFKLVRINDSGSGRLGINSDSSSSGGRMNGNCSGSRWISGNNSFDSGSSGSISNNSELSSSENIVDLQLLKEDQKLLGPAAVIGPIERFQF